MTLISICLLILFRVHKCIKITMKEVEQGVSESQIKPNSGNPIPPTAKTIYQEAIQKRSNGKYKEARDELLFAHNIVPQWEYPLYELAYTYLLQKDYKNALFWYKKYRDRIPNSSECNEKIVDLFEIMNDIKTVEKHYYDELNTDDGKNDFNVHCNYAKFLQRSKKEYEKSLIYYQKALEIGLSYGQKEKCHIELGMLYYKLGDLNKAIDHTKDALLFDNRCAISLSNLGYFYLKKNEYKLAYKYLIKCIEIDEDYNLINGNLGNCLYEMKRYNESIVYLEKSIKKEIDLNDENIAIRQKCLDNYANILFMKNNYDESIKICQQLIEREDFAKYGNKDKIYYLISHNFEKLNNLDKALEFGLEAMTSKPNEPLYIQNVKNIIQKENCD
eukprot:518713_1